MKKQAGAHAFSYGCIILCADPQTDIQLNIQVGLSVFPDCLELTKVTA